jgi:hypothetical protein
MPVDPQWRTLYRSPEFERLETGVKRSLLEGLVSRGSLSAEQLEATRALLASRVFQALALESQHGLVLGLVRTGFSECFAIEVLEVISTSAFVTLSAEQRRLALHALAGADPVFAATLGALLRDESFGSLAAEEKTAVLAQVQAFANTASVGGLRRLVERAWVHQLPLGW